MKWALSPTIVKRVLYVSLNVVFSLNVPVVFTAAV